MALKVWFEDKLKNLMQSFAMRTLTDDQRQLLNEISVALIGKVVESPVESVKTIEIQSSAP